MKILITGCAGFLGFHLSKKLLEKKNVKVIGIDNVNNYYSILLKKKRLSILQKKKNFKFYKKDISNYTQINNIFKKHKFDLIFHLAAQAGVRYSIENPQAYHKSNYLGFFNIAEISRQHKIKKIIYASSSSVYGESNKFPLTEDQIINPKNVYSLSKKNNEETAEIFSKYYNIKFIGLRLFTIYGEWGRPDMLIMKYILASIKNRKFYLNNFGNHYRDFTYIDDVVNQIIKLSRINIKKKNIIINVCNGKSVSLKYILGSLDKKFKQPKLIKRKKQLADVYKTHGSNKILKEITDIDVFTPIDIGLQKVINWAKDNLKFLVKIN